MATLKQIEANRRNAKSSTGPRTPEGKARSRQNAFKTGLYASGITIGHENPMALEELERQFTDEYHPVTATERSLVDSLIHLEWMLRRYRWLETEVWRSTQDLLTREQLELCWTGHAFINQPAIARIHRLRITTHRAFHETLAQLQAVQNAEPSVGRDAVPRADCPSAPSLLGPEPALVTPQPEQNKAPVEEIGFVPSETVDDATPAPDPRSPAPFSPSDPPPPQPPPVANVPQPTNRPPDPVV